MECWGKRLIGVTSRENERREIGEKPKDNLFNWLFCKQDLRNGEAAGRSMCQERFFFKKCGNSQYVCMLMGNIGR